MGAVFLAYDTQLHRPVALKVLSDSVDSDTARARLLREARNAAALNHPNICTVHEVGSVDGATFIAMEYVEGRSLQELLEGGALPIEQACRYASQAASALGFAHDNGVIHRDFKAANVIVTNSGRLKIVDFGLARREDTKVVDATTMASLTVAGAAVGTPYSMAPEQVRGEVADARADVWALGVLLYQMVSGARPFSGATVPELFSSILRDSPASHPESVPLAMQRLIEHCLSKRAEERPNASAVLAGLEAIQSNTDLHAGPAFMRRSRRWIRAAALLVAIGAALVLAIPFTSRLRIAPQPSTVKLAVLPFKNLTGDAAQDYLSDGLTDDTITQLGRLQPQLLKVIARTSSMRYKDTDKPLDQIGRELEVDYLLEGSARREGDRVRVTAALINARDQTQRWSDTFEREFASVMALQGELARGVARSLAITLLPGVAEGQASRVVNAEAYELYLKGRVHWYRMTPQDFATAASYFERAIEKDPNYAAAYVGLADAVVTPAHVGFAPTTELFPKAQALAAKALAIDPTSPDAHDIAGRLLFAWDWDWPAAEREFKRSAELAPNYPDVHVVYSQLLLSTGRLEEALVEARRALDLDPQNPLYQSQVAMALSALNRKDEGIAELLKIVTADPNSIMGHDLLWDFLHLAGRNDDALREGTRSLTLMGRQNAADALARGNARAGYRGAMEDSARILISERPQAYVGAATIGRLYAHAGLTDQAIEWLQTAAEERDTRLIYVIGDPVYETVRRDPRFAALVERAKAVAKRPAASAVPRR